MLQYLREAKAKWDWNRSELGRMINIHNKNFMNIPRIAEFSDERKQNMIGDLVTSIQSIATSENPLAALRQEIVDAAYREADLAILCITEKEKRDGFYVNVAGISGELHHRISDCAQHQDGLRTVLPHIDLADLASENMSETEALREVTNTQSLIALYHLNGLNMTRNVFSDGLKARDWLRPLMVSTMILKEDHYRGKIGMRSLLAEGEAFRHLAFGSLTLRETDPLKAWEAEFGVRHPYQP